VKRLVVLYGDITLVDSDVEELTWADSEGAVSVSAKWRTAKSAPSSGLLELLAGATRQRAQKNVAQPSEATPEEEVTP